LEVFCGCSCALGAHGLTLDSFRNHQRQILRRHQTLPSINLHLHKPRRRPLHRQPQIMNLPLRQIRNLEMTILVRISGPRHFLPTSRALLHSHSLHNHQRIRPPHNPRQTPRLDHLPTLHRTGCCPARSHQRTHPTRHHCRPQNSSPHLPPPLSLSSPEMRLTTPRAPPKKRTIQLTLRPVHFLRSGNQSQSLSPMPQNQRFRGFFIPCC